jgi:hypothetical protein
VVGSKLPVEIPTAPEKPVRLIWDAILVRDMETHAPAVTYWRNKDRWEQWVKQYGHIGIDTLSEYLVDIPEQARDFARGQDLYRVMVNEEAASTWETIVSDCSDEELVTLLFITVEAVDTGRQYTVQQPGKHKSDIGAHGPWALVIKHLGGETLESVRSWLTQVDEENRVAGRIGESLSRHGPYDVRTERCERARSAYPYVAELVTQVDAQPNPEWWDVDACWFGDDASFKTFRDHLINHWTDAPCSQGGIIARELAAQLSMNPIWDTINEPYTGYGTLHIPHETPPAYLVERFDRLRRQTRDFYRDRGVTHKTLYRGLPHTTTRPAALESWTNSREEAERYAHTRDLYDSDIVEKEGVVLEREVPVELIAFSYESVPTDRWYSIAGYKGGPPDSPLREFAVLGGSGVGGSDE